MTAALVSLIAILWLLGMIPTAMAGKAEGANMRRRRTIVLIVAWPVAVAIAVVKHLAEELSS